MKVKGSVEIYGNVESNGEVSGAFKSYDGFPLDPKVGTWAIIDRNLMLCVSIEDMPVWMPLTKERNTFTREQKVAAKRWILEHRFNSSNVLIQCFDPEGNVVVPDSIKSIDENTTEVAFPSEMAGRAIAMFGYESGVSATGRARISDEQYKIGSCYLTTLDVNPFDDLGYGEWELVKGDGAVLEFGDGSECNLEVQGTNLKDVPLPEHSHDASFHGDRLPDHSHSFSRPRGDRNWSDGGGNSWWGSNGNAVKVTTSSESAGTPSGSVSVSKSGSPNAKLNVKGATIKINVWVRKR